MHIYSYHSKFIIKEQRNILTNVFAQCCIYFGTYMVQLIKFSIPQDCTRFCICIKVLKLQRSFLRYFILNAVICDTYTYIYALHFY